MNAEWTSVSPLPVAPLDELISTNPRGPGKNIVFFHPELVQNNANTLKAGRPMFDEQIFLTVLIPGDASLKIDRKCKAEDKLKYPIEWARFEQGKQQRVPGYPIEHWHGISPTQRAEFRALNIFTVEQFAELEDSVGQRIGMGFHELRRRAKLFVESGKDAEALAAKTREVDALRAEVAELKALIEGKTAPEKVLA